LVFSILAVRGWLVVSPELGLLLVEGGAIAYWSIVVLTLSSAMSLGLLVPAVGHAVDRPSNALWSHLGAMAVAAFAVASIRTTNPTDSAELRIAAYDLWSPVLVPWLAFSRRVTDVGQRVESVDCIKPVLGSHRCLNASAGGACRSPPRYSRPPQVQAAAGA
jgi:hypothetical protein